MRYTRRRVPQGPPRRKSRQQPLQALTDWKGQPGRAQAPERVKPRSVLDPCGSRIASRSMIWLRSPGSRPRICSLIPAINSSTVPPVTTLALMSPARCTRIGPHAYTSPLSRPQSAPFNYYSGDESRRGMRLIDRMLPLDEWRPDDRAQLELLLARSARPYESLGGQTIGPAE